MITKTKILWPSLTETKTKTMVIFKNGNNIKIKMMYYKTYKNEKVFKENENITKNISLYLSNRIVLCILSMVTCSTFCRILSKETVEHMRHQKQQKRYSYWHTWQQQKHYRPIAKKLATFSRDQLCRHGVAGIRGKKLLIFSVLDCWYHCTAIARTRHEKCMSATN